MTATDSSLSSFLQLDLNYFSEALVNVERFVAPQAPGRANYFEFEIGGGVKLPLMRLGHSSCSSTSFSDL